MEYEPGWQLFKLVLRTQGNSDWSSSARDIIYVYGGMRSGYLKTCAEYDCNK